MEWECFTDLPFIQFKYCVLLLNEVDTLLYCICVQWTTADEMDHAVKARQGNYYMGTLEIG